MADMYGAVRSNWFKVKDVDAFTEWFVAHVRFGEEIQLWAEDDNMMAFGGYEMYPSAYPSMPMGDDDDTQPQWDLDAFAAEVRKHLCPDQEFRVFAAGHEKLRYVAGSHLIVTHDTVTFDCYEEGN